MARQRRDRGVHDLERTATRRYVLAGQQGPHDGHHLLSARSAGAQRVPERAECLGGAAGGERHDQRCVDEGAEGADLLGEQEWVVEGRKQHHSDRHSTGHHAEPGDRRHRLEHVPVHGRRGVVVADEQAPQVRPPGRRRHLDEVGGLLAQVVRTHRSFEKRSGLGGCGQALVDLERLGTSGKEEPQRRSYPHPSTSRILESRVSDARSSRLASSQAVATARCPQGDPCSSRLLFVLVVGALRPQPCPCQRGDRRRECAGHVG